MTTNSSSKRPTHAVYVVEGDRENAFWTKIGSAWEHEDRDGYNIALTAMPLNGRLVVRKSDQKEKETQRTGRGR